MIAFEVLGWLGAILFSCCGIPQVIKTYRTKSTKDLSWWFLLMWFGGEVFTTIYVAYCNVTTDKIQWSLLTNYFINIGIVIYLLYLKRKYG